MLLTAEGLDCSAFKGSFQPQALYDFVFQCCSLWRWLCKGGLRMILDTFPSCLFWVGVIPRVSTGDAVQLPLEVSIIIICLIYGSASSLSWMRTVLVAQIPELFLASGDSPTNNSRQVQAIPLFPISLPSHIFWASMGLYTAGFWKMI